MQPTKNDLGSRFAWKCENGNEKEELSFEITGASGRGVYEKLAEIIDKKKHFSVDEFANEVLQLQIHQTNGNISIKGVIAVIMEEQKAVIFESHTLRNRILEENGKNPFQVYYIVNGKVKYASSDNGKKLWRILSPNSLKRLLKQHNLGQDSI